MDKPSYSYIVHPTNHYQDYITDPLVKLKVEKNEIENLFNSAGCKVCNT